MKKILIIDDEEAIVRMLQVRLQANGYKTFGANDGYQGLKLAKESKPDLVLLDLQMPAGGGVHTFNNLKASTYTSGIPIIIFTSFPGNEVKKLVMELGADAFLPKSVKSADLLKKIAELIDK